MRRIASLVLVLLGCQAAGAQTPYAASPDHDAVLALVDKFMHAVSTDDSAAMKALALEGTLNTVAGPAPDGGTRITRRPFASGAPPAGPRPERRERYWDPTVLIRGSIAKTAGPNSSNVAGRPSACSRCRIIDDSSTSIPLAALQTCSCDKGTTASSR